MLYLLVVYLYRGLSLLFSPFAVYVDYGGLFAVVGCIFIQNILTDTVKPDVL